MANIGSFGVYALPNPTSSGDFAITAAGTYVGGVITGFGGVNSLSAQISFNYGSGGTSATYYLQTSLDQGNTWIDIAAHQFTTASGVDIWNFEPNASLGPVTPGDGSMASGSKQDGIIGDRFRVKVVTVGTYANTTLAARICTR